MSGLVERQIPLELVDLDEANRLRPVDLAAADRIAVSMKDRGQLTAIEVRPAEGGRYKLTHGAHRLVAAQRAGLQTIRAVIFECEDDEARLREIDENLHRVELTPFDQANFIEERRQVWERLRGKITRGGDRRSKGQIVPLIDLLKTKGFERETGKNLGLHPKTVKRALARKCHMAPDVWTSLRGTEAETNAALLDKMRKLDFSTQRAVFALKQERGCALLAAIRLVTQQEETGAAKTDDAAASALIRAWKKASPSARRQFEMWRKTQP